MTGKKIKAENWNDYVEGYFLGIDFTDNDMRQSAKKNQAPWMVSCGQDQFFAVSGFIHKDQVRNPHDLDLSLFINGKIR